MHRSLAVLLLAVTAVAGAFTSATPVLAAAALSPAKVVIVVGATHGTTPTYRKYADAAYAEAIRHTSNVVKVYSPNATWSKVKSAAVGASVLIYFGHGNGWPSPYTYDPNYTTKDGTAITASRTSRPSTSRRTRSSCSTTCATRRATRSQATRTRR